MSRKFGEIQIRAPRRYGKGEIIQIKARIIHPMETGFRKDKTTQQVIPAHYINEVKVFYGDELLTAFDWTYAVSRDPLLTFYLRADRTAPLKIVWRDNKGKGGEKIIPIAPQ